MSSRAIPFSLPRPALSALFVALMLPLLSACGFNTIPTNEERAKAAWSEVLNQ
jgi:LemA protein